MNSEKVLKSNQFRMAFKLVFSSELGEVFDLSIRKREVVELYFIHGKSLDEIGEKFNLSKQRIQFILDKTMKELEKKFRTAVDEYKAYKKSMYELDEINSFKAHLKDFAKRIDLPTIEKVEVHKDMLVENLPISARLKNILTNNGYVYFGQLGDLSCAQLRKYRNSGDKCVEEFRTLMKSYNKEVLEKE